MMWMIGSAGRGLERASSRDLASMKKAWNESEAVRARVRRRSASVSPMKLEP